MRFSLIGGSCAAVFALAVVGATMAQENPYKQPLVIGDEVASRGYRIVDVQDDLTTLGFILIDPGVVTEDSRISIQMGSDKDTRAAVEQAVSPTIMRMLDPQSDIGLQMMDAQKLRQQELR